MNINSGSVPDRSKEYDSGSRGPSTKYHPGNEKIVKVISTDLKPLEQKMQGVITQLKADINKVLSEAKKREFNNQEFGALLDLIMRAKDEGLKVFKKGNIAEKTFAERTFEKTLIDVTSAQNLCLENLTAGKVWNKFLACRPQKGTYRKKIRNSEFEIRKKMDRRFLKFPNFEFRIPNFFFTSFCKNGLLPTETLPEKGCR
jgi:hypothetical protein